MLRVRSRKLVFRLGSSITHLRLPQPFSCFLKDYQVSAYDFEAILSKFILRLTERGHKIENLIPILLQAAAFLNSSVTQHRLSSSNDIQTMYLHWSYHPHGIQRTKLRQLCNEYLAPVLNYDKMVIAMSRPRNLKDLLTKTALTPTTSRDATNMVTWH